MATTRFETALSSVEANGVRLHNVVNADANTDVTLSDGSTIASVKKTITTIQTSITAANNIPIGDALKNNANKFAVVNSAETGYELSTISFSVNSNLHLILTLD